MSPPETARDTDFAALVARLEPRLMAYLWSACGNRADAEDLFQEVCLALHQQGLDAERPDAWAFRVAHNRAVNFVKRKGIERKGLKIVGGRSTEAVAGPDAEREERSARIRAALATLPEDEREAVALKIWGESTWVEIGRVLGISEDAAARLFARGLRAVAPLLKPLAEDLR